MAEIFFVNCIVNVDANNLAGGSVGANAFSDLAGSTIPISLNNKDVVVGIHNEAGVGVYSVKNGAPWVDLNPENNDAVIFVKNSPVPFQEGVCILIGRDGSVTNVKALALDAVQTPTPPPNPDPVVVVPPIPDPVDSWANWVIINDLENDFGNPQEVNFDWSSKMPYNGETVAVDSGVVLCVGLTESPDGLYHMGDYNTGWQFLGGTSVYSAVDISNSVNGLDVYTTHNGERWVASGATFVKEGS